MSKSLFSKVSKSTLSSICDILQARPLSSRLCGRRCCKKGDLNLHSQRPFLTQSLASCHITLPSCPPAFALRQCVSRKQNSAPHSSPLTSNYCSECCCRLPKRCLSSQPALMASLSNQSKEDRAGPHMGETAPWLGGSRALADKV